MISLRRTGLMIGLLLTVSISSAEKITDVYDGLIDTYAHPLGRFAFDLPTGWTVGQEEDDTLPVNPGFAPGESQDAIILLSYGELEDDQLSQSPSELMHQYSPDLRASIEALGISLDAADSKPAPVESLEFPAATQKWSGTAGSRPITAWLAGMVADGEYMLVSGVMMKEREQDFLPGLKRIFVSLHEPEGGQTDWLVSAIVGMSFKGSGVGPAKSMSFDTWFFHGENQVMSKYILTNVGIMEEWGRYEIIGNQLSVAFDNSQKEFTIHHDGSLITGLGTDSLVTMHPR